MCTRYKPPNFSNSLREVAGDLTYAMCECNSVCVRVCVINEWV